MKQLNYFIFLMLWVSITNAQHFSKEYGVDYGVNPGQGVKGVVMPGLNCYGIVGYGVGFITGDDPRSGPCQPYGLYDNLYVNKVATIDYSGNTIFKKGYYVLNSQDDFPSCPLVLIPNDIEEHNGLIYVTGIVHSTGKAYLLILDANGNPYGSNPLIQYEYFTPSPSLTNPVICKDNYTSDLFLVGGIDGYGFAMRLDMYGSIVWSHRYAFGTDSSLFNVFYHYPKDALMTNYGTFGSSPNELLIVGEAGPPLGSSLKDKIFMLYVDPTTGTPFYTFFSGSGTFHGTSKLHNFARTTDSLDVKSLIATNAGGYALIGNIKATSANYDALTMKFTATGSPIWVTAHDHPSISLKSNRMNSIIENIDVSLGSEFFIGGTKNVDLSIYPPYMITMCHTNDYSIYKLDGSGMAIEEYEAFNSLLDEVVSLDNDIVNGNLVTLSSGCSTWGLPNMEIRTMGYDGSCCDCWTNQFNTISRVVPDFVIDFYSDTTGYFIQSSLYVDQIPIQEAFICQSSSSLMNNVPEKMSMGGNVQNVYYSRENEYLKIFPPELGTGISKENIIDVSIYDGLGKLVIQKKHVTSGAHFDDKEYVIDGIILSRGIYFVTISNGSEVFTSKFRVE